MVEGSSMVTSQFYPEFSTTLLKARGSLYAAMQPTFTIHWLGIPVTVWFCVVGGWLLV